MGISMHIHLKKNIHVCMCIYILHELKFKGMCGVQMGVQVDGTCDLGRVSQLVAPDLPRCLSGHLADPGAQEVPVADSRASGFRWPWLGPQDQGHRSGDLGQMVVFSWSSG